MSFVSSPNASQTKDAANLKEFCNCITLAFSPAKIPSGDAAAM